MVGRLPDHTPSHQDHNQLRHAAFAPLLEGVTPLAHTKLGTNLKVINLSFCKMSEVPPALCELRAVVSIDVRWR